MTGLYSIQPEAIEWTMEQTALLRTVLFFPSLFTLFDLRRVPSVVLAMCSTHLVNLIARDRCIIGQCLYYLWFHAGESMHGMSDVTSGCSFAGRKVL